MENNSEYLDLIKHKKGRVEMSDVLLARALVQDIGGKGRVSDMLYSALKTLRQMFPHHEEPHKQWSERRLKGWWNRESENVMHWQMVELYKAAAKAKEERELLAAARREHAEFVAKTARIAALLEHQDEDFHCENLAELGKRLSRMGGSGTEGDR